MRRYIYGKNLSGNTDKYFDAVIIGGGMAGLYASLMLDPKFSVALIVKSNITDGGSSWLAQGGVACMLDSKKDSFESHIEDTLAAGAGHCDPEAVKTLVCEGPHDIQNLIDFKVPFDRNENGSLHLTREGGHRCNRIIHCGGDATGKEITKRLGELVLSKDNISVFFEHYLVDIITENNIAKGVIVNNGKDEFVIKSGNIIVASGGAGQLYKYSTTPSGNTGEGIAVCDRAGCKCADMEFVQFHPTGFAIHKENERVFLISEAVRGEGAVLKNKFGQAFMKNPGQHPLADLAPRDIVTRAILKEMNRTGEKLVYLDAGCMTEEFFEKRFPTITAECRKNNIFPPRDLIPVSPTQHYLMGGVRTDTFSRTNIKGIFVCGEAACTGVHGGNRLASNSTLECLVFSRRAAEYINRNFTNYTEVSMNLESSTGTMPCPSDSEIKKDFSRLKQIMSDNAGAVRTMDGLKNAESELCGLFEKYALCKFENQAGYSIYDAIEVAKIIVKSAISRKESLGAHYVVENL